MLVLLDDEVYGVGVGFVLVLLDDEVYGVGVGLVLVDMQDDVVEHLLPAGLVIVVTTVLFPVETDDSGHGVDVVYVLSTSVDCSQVATFVLVTG